MRDLFDSLDDGIVLSPEDFLDLDVRLSQAEQTIRPKSANIVQLQMDGLDSYAVYLYPDTVRDFSNPDVVRRFLAAKGIDEMSVERLMSMAANFKVANLDLADANRVLPVYEAARLVI